MKVVLIKNDSKLGKIGDIKEVSEGFAMNYLFPNNIAKAATAGEVAKAQASRKKQERQRTQGKINQPGLLEKLDSLKLAISAKADENGTFFAKITADKIAAELKKSGINIKSKMIKLDEPIKKAGEYKIDVKAGDKNITIDLVIKSE
ncbi:MAG TPA: 50S ribosomal protein L9 [Candidatus Bipolaricaulota bacterium]|nr:50S ribosomal protein L9 [Candidatus Bipolaricaulota bacterium]